MNLRMAGIGYSDVAEACPPQKGQSIWNRAGKAAALGRERRCHLALLPPTFSARGTCGCIQPGSRIPAVRFPVAVLARETTVRQVAVSTSDIANSVVLTGPQFRELTRAFGSTRAEAGWEAGAQPL